jgi:hypothetical protein
MHNHYTYVVRLCHVTLSQASPLENFRSVLRHHITRVQTSKLLYMYECCSHNLLSIDPSWLAMSWRIRVYIESLHFGSSHSWIENHEMHPVGCCKLRQYTHSRWNPIDSKSKETDLVIETLIGSSIFKSIYTFLYGRFWKSL